MCLFVIPLYFYFLFLLGFFSREDFFISGKMIRVKEIQISKIIIIGRRGGIVICSIRKKKKKKTSLHPEVLLLSPSVIGYLIEPFEISSVFFLEFSFRRSPVS